VLADEQPLADGGVRKAVAGQSRNLSLLGGELLARFDGALADALAGGLQLTLGARDECLRAHAREQLERGAQLVAGVEAAPLATQPLAVEQVGPCELQAHAGAPQPRDRLLVEPIGGVAVAE
jgi:hypothetical protein